MPHLVRDIFEPTMPGLAALTDKHDFKRCTETLRKLAAKKSLNSRLDLEMSSVGQTLSLPFEPRNDLNHLFDETNNQL